MNNIGVKAILKNPLENLSNYLPLSHRYAPDKFYHGFILRCLTYNPDWRPHFRDLIELAPALLNDKM